MALLFVALSCADLALTGHLLRLGHGEVYEANWLAAGVLARYGLTGLAVFKALVTLLTGVLVGILALSRPERARRLAAFACLAVGAVVLYSLTLWGQLAAQPASASHDWAVIKGEGRRRDEAQSIRNEFVALSEKWAAALAEGHCTVREAVAGLLNSRSGQDPGRLAAHRAMMGVNSQEDCLAGLVVAEALHMLDADGSSAARARAEQLLALCRADYGPEVYTYLVQVLPGRRPGKQPNGVDVASLATGPGPNSLGATALPRQPRSEAGGRPHAGRRPSHRWAVHFVGSR
jgi:hypothetical protein